MFVPCLHACACADISSRSIDIPAYLHTCIHTYIHAHTHTYSNGAGMYINIYIHTHTTKTHAHAYIHAYHTCVYIHTHIKNTSTNPPCSHATPTRRSLCEAETPYYSDTPQNNETSHHGDFSAWGKLPACPRAVA